MTLIQKKSLILALLLLAITFSASANEVKFEEPAGFCVWAWLSTILEPALELAAVFTLEFSSQSDDSPAPIEQRNDAPEAGIIGSPVPIG